LNDSKAIVAERTVEKDQQVIFDNLTPGSYHIRIIADRNRDGKWTAGNYFRKRQPELLIAYPPPFPFAPTGTAISITEGNRG